MWRTLFFLISFHYNLKVIHAKSMVPCYFIFGDSLSDPGNNNDLQTMAKSNYKPYGIDYPGGRPTGRFTNGRTAVDIIAEHLGFEEHIAPYRTATGDQILKGVNYASGSAGIRSETGSHLGERISLDVQLKNHKNVITRLETMLNGSTADYLTKCLYTVNIGSNDYIHNYFMPKLYPTSTNYTPVQFAKALADEYSGQLKALYESGARKIAVYGLAQLGCIIAEVDQHPFAIPCENGMNLVVAMFNVRLMTLLPQLTDQFPNATFTYISSDIIGFVGPILEGVLIWTEPCCEVRESYMCKESVAPCDNRSLHYFFDGLHPTEAVNKITGARAFHALTPFEAFPYDISHLVQL